MPSASRSTSRRADGPAPVIEVSGRLYPVEVRYRPFDGRADDDDHERRDRATRSTSCGEDLRRERPGRHPRVPARRARDPRGRRAPAQALTRRERRDPAAVRAPVAGGAGPRVRAAQRAPHRARDQRRRDLADRAGHPLRDRRRHWRASSATASATRSSSCRSSRSAQAAANQRAGRCGRVADGICIRLYDEEDFAGAAALHRPGDPALVARRRDPAHEVAAASARSRTSRSSSRRRAARSPTATSCSASSARSTTPTS